MYALKSLQREEFKEFKRKFSDNWANNNKLLTTTKLRFLTGEVLTSGTITSSGAAKRRIRGWS